MLHNDMTVVMEIHQPSSRLYKKFDKLMLFPEGHCTYLGPSEHAMNYFHELGFRSLIEMNPPEFFLDLCSGYVAGIEAPEDLNGRHRRISQSDHSDHSNNETFDDNGGRQVEDPRVNSSSDDSDRSNNEGLLTEEGRKVRMSKFMSFHTALVCVNIFVGNIDGDLVSSMHGISMN